MHNPRGRRKAGGRAHRRPASRGEGLCRPTAHCAALQLHAAAAQSRPPLARGLQLPCRDIEDRGGARSATLTTASEQKRTPPTPSMFEFVRMFASRVDLLVLLVLCACRATRLALYRTASTVATTRRRSCASAARTTRKPASDSHSTEVIRSCSAAGFCALAVAGRPPRCKSSRPRKTARRAAGDITRLEGAVRA